MTYPSVICLWQRRSYHNNFTMIRKCNLAVSGSRGSNVSIRKYVFVLIRFVSTIILRRHTVRDVYTDYSFRRALNLIIRPKSYINAVLSANRPISSGSFGMRSDCTFWEVLEAKPLPARLPATIDKELIVGDIQKRIMTIAFAAGHKYCKQFLNFTFLSILSVHGGLWQ